MLESTINLLTRATSGGYAIGAFNVYNLEAVRAVIMAAERSLSPAMLQLHPAALKFGGQPLISLCLAAARESTMPIAVHLDHSTAEVDIRQALEAGISSVMADGSALAYTANVTFTTTMTDLGHSHHVAVEAELGRLTGTEDGLTVAEYEVKLTDPDQAGDFVRATGIDALAVCIGNVHGVYKAPPQLDFDRLAAIRQAVSVPLVLHGASGLPADQISRSIDLGVRKFNVNTELRAAYVDSLRRRLAETKVLDVLDLMQEAVDAMQTIVTEKLTLFRSVNRVLPDARDNHGSGM